MQNSTNYFPSGYEEFIFKSRYARWLESEGRREDWPETVERMVTFIKGQLKTNHNFKLDQKTTDEIREAVLSFEVMPSMRSLMTSGPALARDNTAGYNCSYLPVDDPKSFDEAMFILLCGTGVGFSCEWKNVQKLPDVPDALYDSETVIMVRDSKEGWAKAFRQLIALLYSGEIPKWDVSRVRPAGARLKTFGGRASGPQPLVDLFEFTSNLFKNAAGRKLNCLEAHDIMCKVGEIVVVGGVRRSAMISLSDLSDKLLANAKSIYDVQEYILINETDTEWHYTLTMKEGQATHPTYRIKLNKETHKWDRQQLESEKKIGWWVLEPQRALANNSATYEESPDVLTFMDEWSSLIASQSGERGIFNRDASRRTAEKTGRRDVNHEFGTNPCSEIVLRPYQFCNLSECVVREKDDLQDLKRKVRIATILGTFQSTLTHFPYLRKVWKSNTEEERLLGVSLTGIMDNAVLANTADSERWLQELRELAVETNKTWAKKLGIPQSASITCVKPSGTVSQLVDAASGIHTRHNPHYIRTVRGDKKDPLTQFMIDSGIPAEDCVMKPDTTVVFSFPKKAPTNAVCRNDKSAIKQLELWLLYQKFWCEHKPSVSITVKESEWLQVGAWVYDNFDDISGISFMPFSEHTYKQAPYQDCSVEEYEEMLSKMPAKINWSKLSEYEKEDNTISSQTLACTGGVCEIVDIAS
jgi:ribonucleoside-diphosphate reductase alpha chain